MILDRSEMAKYQPKHKRNMPCNTLIKQYFLSSELPVLLRSQILIENEYVIFRAKDGQLNQHYHSKDLLEL